MEDRTFIDPEKFALEFASSNTERVDLTMGSWFIILRIFNELFDSVLFGRKL
uniref:hypothetical protein n=1 Tax=Tetragenococcus halophilus TaxID=51669 RepID=UPI001EECBA60|nr:hypothetical protein [Tetragenococcus halophilus]